MVIYTSPGFGIPESSYHHLFASDEFFTTQTHMTVPRIPSKQPLETTEGTYWLDELLEKITGIDEDIASNVSVEQLIDINVSIEENCKPRMKWKRNELLKLWSGIALYGNEWREVQKHVGCRTYSQVKDKGRRLLQNENWKTGKKKNDADEGKLAAKRIAKRKLKAKQPRKKRKTQLSKTVKSSERQNNFDMQTKRKLVFPKDVVDLC